MPGTRLAAIDRFARLITCQVTPHAIFHRIFPSHHPDPLGVGLSDSRFSDPRRAKRFRVLYIAATFETAFLEAIIRDRRNQNPGSLVIPLTELSSFVHVPVVVSRSLTLLDLRSGNPVAMGVPTDAVRAQSQRLGRQLSFSVYQHPDRIDGLCYPSRLNEGENLAVYDRAISKLEAGPRRTLDTCPELALLLDRYQIAIV